MTSIKDAKAAASNAGLRDRLETAATMAGIDPAAVWARMGALVSKPLDAANGQTLADVLAYGEAQRHAALTAVPGDPAFDEAVIPDAFILDALRALVTPQD